MASRDRARPVLSTDEVADVVVVGGGGSGLAAAVAAASAGAEVLVLERQADLGGTTRISLGAVVGNGSPQQRRAGIADDPRAHEQDLEKAARAAGVEDNAELRRVFVEQVGPTFAWLTDAGISFAGPFEDGPNAVPRLHMALPDSRILTARLEVQARRRSVRLVCGASVERLVLEEGRVVGVEVESRGARSIVRARRGVVLASGDYSGSEELKGRFLGPAAAAVPGINPESRGDGHRMGESVGSPTLNGGSAVGPQLRLAPPARRTLTRRLPATALVSRLARLGHRLLPAKVIDRLTSGLLASYMAVSPDLLGSGVLLVDRTGRALGPGAGSTEGETFVVLDQERSDRFSRWPHFVSTAPGIAYAYVPDYLRARRDAAVQGPPSTIARALGIDAVGLTAAIDQHYGLSGSAGYVALGPLQPWIVVTNGGLRTSPRLEVLREDGSVVPGLFACGSVGQGGFQLLGNGLHLAWAMVSGRRAGESAAGASDVASAGSTTDSAGDV